MLMTGSEVADALRIGQTSHDLLFDDQPHQVITDGAGACDVDLSEQ